MYEVKKIDLISASKVLAILSGVFGLIPSIIGLLFSFLMYSNYNYYSGGSFIFSLISIIVMPIICSIVGFISGLLVAWLYNLLAPIIGGLKINLVFHPDDEPKTE